MKVTPEQTVAHYRIMEPLGAGGMGAVYKAYDKKLQRVVALKLLKPEFLSQQDRRRRFQQEAVAASALNHPHILTVYEVGEHEGKPYLSWGGWRFFSRTLAVFGTDTAHDPLARGIDGR